MLVQLPDLNVAFQLRITVLRLESTVTSDSLPPPHTQMTESYPGTQKHATQR